MKIVIESRDGMFFAQVDDRFTDHLARDEALGVVAAALFGSAVPYLRDYAGWISLLRYYDQWSEPAALLPASVAPMDVSPFVLSHRELIMNGRFICRRVER